jgi:hypothetical protein
MCWINFKFNILIRFYKTENLIFRFRFNFNLGLTVNVNFKIKSCGIKPIMTKKQNLQLIHEPFPQFNGL